MCAGQAPARAHGCRHSGTSGYSHLARHKCHSIYWQSFPGSRPFTAQRAMSAVSFMNMLMKLTALMKIMPLTAVLADANARDGVARHSHLCHHLLNPA
jgi:hypothetical protein